MWDGLKPVQRRLLWTGWERLGLRPGGNNKACARVVGDCVGMLNPHSDVACYQALVNMTQHRYPLFVGKGNFGSSTLDMPAAAYRYTSVFAGPLMAEAFRDKAVTQLMPNYSGETHEPVVIPSRLPLLLMNGSEGIGVAISSHIPPHNLRELVAVLLRLVRKPTTKVSTLVGKYIKGPDYPEGGELRSSLAEVVALYKTGHGTLEFRCQHRIDQVKGGYQLVVTSGCPHWGLSAFTHKCQALIKAGFIKGVSNESGKGQLRVVVMATQREALTKRVLPYITRKLRYNWVALRDKQPVQLNLIEFCRSWLAWRRQVTQAHLQHSLALYKEQHEAESAKLKAIRHIDRTIKAIRSPRPLKALVKGLKLNKRQAKVILRTQLSTLTQKGERQQVGVVTNLVKNIQETKARLLDIDAVVTSELKTLKAYFDARKTKSSL